MKVLSYVCGGCNLPRSAQHSSRMTILLQVLLFEARVMCSSFLCIFTVIFSTEIGISEYSLTIIVLLFLLQVLLCTHYLYDAVFDE